MFACELEGKWGRGGTEVLFSCPCPPPAHSLLSMQRLYSKVHYSYIFLSFFFIVLGS